MEDAWCGGGRDDEVRWLDSEGGVAVEGSDTSAGRRGEERRSPVKVSVSLPGGPDYSRSTLIAQAGPKPTH